MLLLAYNTNMLFIKRTNYVYEIGKLKFSIQLRSYTLIHLIYNKLINCHWMNTFMIADTLPRNMGQETFIERIQSQSLAAHPTIV